jgi:hypothetical protein
MKKLVILSALAVALLLMVEQQASAWCHMKFSAGVNLEVLSGGKSFLWGAYTSSPVPPEVLANMGYGQPGCFDGAADPYYGASDHGVAQESPAPTGGKPANVKPVDYQSWGYGTGGYYPASYYSAGYYPAANYSNFQAPSYWYGR